jgi:hypothetical protein
MSESQHKYRSVNSVIRQYARRNVNSHLSHPNIGVHFHIDMMTEGCYIAFATRMISNFNYRF